MKIRLLFLSILFFSLIAGATYSTFSILEPAATTAFEGTIAFTKKVGSSESKYNYFVKGDKVRIEELGADGTIQGVMLVNTTANTITALSPDRKLYMSIPNKRAIAVPVLEIEKTENSKTLMTYSCTEWIATCKDDDRVISYWMAFDKFDFFIPLLKTLNRKDKQAVYFTNMKGAEGAFPMLGIEKKADGTELSRLTVTAIERKTIDKTKFDIPKGYTKFEN